MLCMRSGVKKTERLRDHGMDAGSERTRGVLSLLRRALRWLLWGAKAEKKVQQ
jgi:hypothetical protein